MALGGLGLGAAGPWWPRLDILSHFRGQCLGLAASAGFALYQRHDALLVLLAGGVLTVLLHAAPAVWARFRRLPAAAGDVPPLKVVSLNIWRRNDNIDRLAAYLRRVDADVVLLYEVYPDKLPVLTSTRDIYPWQLHCAETPHCAVALLSKREWLQAGIRPREGGWPRMVWAEFEHGAAKPAVIGVHLSKPTDRPREQRREIDFLAAFLRRFEGPVVLAGDFNTTPWSMTYRAIEGTTGLKGIVGHAPSWPVSVGMFPQLAIDHLFVSRDVGVAGVALGPRTGSDHLPVVGRFRFRENR